MYPPTEAMIDAGLKVYEKATWTETYGDYLGLGVNNARDTVEKIITDALAARSQKRYQASLCGLNLGKVTGEIIARKGILLSL